MELQTAATRCSPCLFVPKPRQLSGSLACLTRWDLLLACLYVCLVKAEGSGILNTSSTRAYLCSVVCSGLRFRVVVQKVWLSQPCSCQPPNAVPAQLASSLEYADATHLSIDALQDYLHADAAAHTACTVTSLKCTVTSLKLDVCRRCCSRCVRWALGS